MRQIAKAEYNTTKSKKKKNWKNGKWFKKSKGDNKLQT